MKTRTIFLPVAFAVPALFSTAPQSAAAAAIEPISARQNALLGDLDVVVAGARLGSVLLDGQILAAIEPTRSPSTTICTHHVAQKLVVKRTAPTSTASRCALSTKGTKTPLLKAPPTTEPRTHSKI